MTPPASEWMLKGRLMALRHPDESWCAWTTVQIFITAPHREVGIGVMQINSSWLPKLQSMNISKMDLFDPCTNIDVGAWILAHNISQYGYNWTAIGAYNARSPHKRQRYALKIWQQLKQVSAL